MKNKLILKNPSTVYVNQEFLEIDRLDPQFYKYGVMEQVTKIEGQFKMKKANDIFNVITDGDHGKRDYKSSGVPFFTAVNVQEDGFNDNTDLYISEEYEKKLKRSRLSDNCLLIVKTGVGTGISCITGPNVSTGNISADVGLFKDPLIGVDLHFVSTFFNSKSGREFILRSSYGSTRNRLTIAELKNLKIPLPSINVQKYIGDKVRKASVLKEEAKKAHEAYTQIINSIFRGVSKEKFPKGFFYQEAQHLDSNSYRLDSNYYNPTYNKYNEIQADVKELSDFVSLKKGENPHPEKNYTYIEIGDMSRSYLLDKEGLIKGKDLPSRAKLILDKNDIVVALVQESIDVTSFVDVEVNNMLTTNGCAVLVPKNKSMSGFLYAMISSPYFISQKCKYITGTNIRSLSSEDLLKIKIPKMGEETIKEISSLVDNQFKCIRDSQRLILEARNDVEDLINGKLDESKISMGN